MSNHNDLSARIENLQKAIFDEIKDMQESVKRLDENTKLLQQSMKGK